MVDINRFFITNEDIKLEAEYFQSHSDARSAIILCHPHPRFGGNMHNNVISSLFQAFISNKFSTLRFNFRAVGRSTGQHSNGRGELSDVKACIDYLLNDKGIEKIFISGYSFGAGIGCSAINYSPKIMGYAAISLPWDLLGIKYKKLTQTNKPKLFIQGDRDEVASFSKFREHYDFYQEPKTYEIIEGADHFYWGYDKRVANIVLRFFKSLK